MARYEFDAKDFQKLRACLNMFPQIAAGEITKTFHDEGAKWLDESIHIFMPRSGREFAGKAPAAKDSKSLVDREKNSKLSVTIGTKPKWHYLYFPDDGSTTVTHAGNQRFFQRGADAVSGKIVDLCVERITEKFEEGML